MRQIDTGDLAQALFQEAQDALFLVDPDSDQILNANPMAQRLTGFGLAELLGMEATQLFRFEGQGGRNRLAHAASRTGIFHSQEGFLLRTRQDGLWIAVNLTITRLHVKPKPLGMIAARDIREQREALAQLKNIEAELRRVMSSVSDCLWSAELDPAGTWKYRFFSPVVAKIAGQPEDFFLPGPQRWLGVIHPEDRPRIEKTYERLKLGCSMLEEYRIVRPDGSVHWVRDSITVTREKDGPLFHLTGVLADVTARKQAEEALAYERELLTSLMDTIPDNIYFKNSESRFLRVNKAVSDRFGLADPRQAVGKSDFDFFQSDHAQDAFKDEQEVIRTGAPLVDKEEHEIWPDGHESWVSTTKMPLRDRQGRIIGTFGISRDITPRIRAEKALTESERRYRQLAECSLDAIVVTDQQGRITLFNPAAERIFGYTAEEVLGQALDPLMPPEFQDLPLRGQEGPAEMHRPDIVGLTVEFRGRRKDGSDFPLELALSAVDLGGEIQFLGTIRDLTERNRMRDMLVQSEKLASIGMLSAGVAHEINNPLAYVANNLVVLERDTKALLKILEIHETAQDQVVHGNPELFKQLEELARKVDLPYIRGNLAGLLARTREGVLRVTKIVHSMRGLARSDAPQMEEAHLPDLVGMSLEMLRARLAQRGIAVETAYGPTKVWCVPTQLGQVLFNLLLNGVQAIEATGRSGTGKLRVASALVAHDLMVEVADNGCGINVEEIQRIFDPFYTTKPVGEGTGLGLWITHGIITAHGGRIEVDSQPGKGTRFCIFLPMEPRGRTLS